ncbi:MAG: hypothetical protein JJT88_05440 [Gammaproteobacteria bacterium]|nr:hypothetical protein [Gammaproteobacteria bacterium]
MECAVAIEETTRNLLMLLTWLPSLAAAAAVFTLLLRARRPERGVRRTVYALGSGMVTLFATWGLLLMLGGRLLC